METTNSQSTFGSVVIPGTRRIHEFFFFLFPQPLEGFHQLAQQILQVEDLLHQQAFDRRLLSAGRVDALSRLPPHQDLMLEFWKSKTPRAEENNRSGTNLKHFCVTHTHAHTTRHYRVVTVGLSSCG